MLELRPASFKEAEYAAQTWHYSGTLAAPMRQALAVLEDGEWIGCIVFGCGATPNLGKPYGLEQNQICELTRVALRSHHTPVSRILSIALMLLHKQRPEIRLIVSFADSGQGHIGTIYQAGNWLYVGKRESHAYRVNGKVYHPRTLHRLHGKGGQSVEWLRANVDPRAERIKVPVKYKYLYVFDPALRETLRAQRLPYPKCGGKSDGGLPVIPDRRSGFDSQLAAMP